MKDKKETNVLKDAAKSFVKGVTFSSVFDHDMSGENANNTKSLSIRKYLVIFLEERSFQMQILKI